MNTGIWIAQFDVGTSNGPTAVSRRPTTDDNTAMVLVRQDRRPLGFITVPVIGGEVQTDDVASAIRTQLTDRAACPADPPSPNGVPSTRSMTVVVCTREHPDTLARCLRSLREVKHSDVEVIVVDNAPTTDRTRECFDREVGDDARFRYLLEPVAGLSRARNAGMRAATTTYVAFTDDDVEVDPWWLDAIAAGFARDPDAGCVTGLVPPAVLDHPAQVYFDRRYTWATRMEPRVYDLDERRDDSPLYPYSAGLFGTGANLAVDRLLMLDLGGFDEALGAGTPSGGGEDLDAFVRVLQAGRTIVYEPSAVVWHSHRCDFRSLRRQLYFYGCGLVAFLTKHVADRKTRREVVSRVPPGLVRLGGTWSDPRADGSRSVRNAVVEMAGMLAGPIAYVRGRRIVEQRTRTQVGPPAAGRTHLPRLTALRAVAAFVVFGFHIHRYTGWSPASIFAHGYVAVGLFFVLSGIVLTWATEPGTGARAFWRRRFARVYPSHLVMAALALLVPVTVVGATWAAAVPNVLLIQAWIPRAEINFGLNGVSWSLSCEMFFYASFPFVVPRLRRSRRGRRWTIVGCWYLATAIITLLGALRGGGWDIVTFVNPLVRSGQFFLGVALALDLIDGRFSRPRVGPALVAAFVALVSMAAIEPPGHAADVLLAPFVVTVLVSAAVSDVRGRTGWMTRRGFIYLGELSFAFYLVHELVILNLAKLLGASTPIEGLEGGVFVLAALAGSLAVAMVLHHGFAVPAQRWIARRRTQPSTAQPMPSSLSASA